MAALVFLARRILDQASKLAVVVLEQREDAESLVEVNKLCRSILIGSW